MRHFVGFELKVQKWPRGDNIIVDVFGGASMNTAKSNIQIQPGLKATLLLTRIYNLSQTLVCLYSTNQLTLEDIHVTFDGKAK